MLHRLILNILEHKMVQGTLFDDKRKLTENQQNIGNGYYVEWVNNNFLTVYRYGVPYKTTELNAQIDKRLLAIELVLECQVTKYKLAEALKISRQTLDTWIATYKKSGTEGLVNSYKGSKSKGRKDNAKKLPTGNKSKQLEQERKQKREALLKSQLNIDFEEAEDGPKIDETEIFNENHEFQETRYAGGFLYWGVFLHYFNFMRVCESIYGKSSDVIYLFAIMLVFGFNSVEQLKTVYKREFGRVLGVKQLFSKPKIWQKIHGACNLKASKRLINKFFEYLAQKALIALSWLYIDGHFIPYYGKETIHPGFYTQRDQMMPGQTEMFVHDSKGNIVYFELQEGKGDLKEMMHRMSEKWTAYLGGEQPLIIADRESWGVDHFISMSSSSFRFVTWEKFSKQEELSSISDENFSDIFTVNNKEYQVFEDEKIYSNNEGNSIELKRIIIWNKKTGKRAACVCPKEEKEDTITLARAMLGRWGASENSFKHMGDRFNMHYNPVQDIAKVSDNQEIDNPDYKALTKEVKKLKKDISKYEQALGRLPLTKNKDGSIRKSKKRVEYPKKIQQLKVELIKAKEELDKCPKRVNLNDAKPGKKFKELNTEGKNLWDLAESLVWNSRKKLIEMLSAFLPDIRDQIPVLEAITKCRGWVRSSSEAIEIRLEPLETPRFKAAQIQLCRTLNEKKIRLLNGKLLLYDVGNKP